MTLEDELAQSLHCMKGVELYQKAELLKLGIGQDKKRNTGKILAMEATRDNSLETKCATQTHITTPLRREVQYNTHLEPEAVVFLLPRTKLSFSLFGSSVRKIPLGLLISSSP